MKKIFCLIPLLTMLSGCEALCKKPDNPPTEKQTIRKDIQANPQMITPNP